MIERGLKLKAVSQIYFTSTFTDLSKPINRYLTMSPELKKYALTPSKWKKLQNYYKILAVNLFC